MYACTVYVKNFNTYRKIQYIYMFQRKTCDILTARTALGKQNWHASLDQNYECIYTRQKELD